MAEALATPRETYLAAEALAATVFPREVGVDALMRLHGLSHAQALRIEREIRPYRPAAGINYAFYRGQERSQGLEEE